ncbi:unnamed protein product, partial [Mesorhabditis belari]|uniref:Methyltransferase domain-containing protein n=1 Tax=Mesorhabditis belari TaxID=2138241 RepID=A0AAF3EDY3_9BILA
MTSREMLFIYLLVFLSVLLFFQIHHNTNLTQEIHHKVYSRQKTPQQTLIEKLTSFVAAPNSNSNCRLDDSVLKMYKIQHENRVRLMKTIRNQGDENTGFAMLYNGIVPEIFCPSLIRVGNVDDGGKWVCNPVAMPANCVVMSLGVATDPSFEREIQLISDQKCSVQSYDKDDSVIDGFEKINAFFTKALISTRDNPETNERSIRGEMKRLKIDRVEILKIDIEGSEFTVIPDLIDQATFCQILIEIHGKPKDVIDLIVKMAKKGYRLFSYEINGRFHFLSEYSFIHDDCLKQYEAVALDYYWHLV